MKKRIFSLIILMLMVLVPKVNACVLTYDEYSEYNIQQSFIVGEYVFNTDTGYSPSLEDFAIAARTIPEGEEEYIYQVLNIDMGSTKYYKKTEIFSNSSNQNTADFPKSDVTWEYWNNINGASEDDYDMFVCMVGDCDIKISYTTLETVGEGEYKTEATRTVQIESDNKIKEVYYCLTSGEECEPTTKAQLGNDNTIKVKYETSISGQKVCTKVVDEYGNYTETKCDDIYVLVDSGFAQAKATENLGTVIEKEPNPIDELFEITYSVSGGETIYYYYVDGEKHLLTDLADLPEGQIEVEVKVIGGNGLVITSKRVINVVNHTVTYDYQTNGGTSSDITKYKASFKGKAKLTEKAYKEGYEFVGWALTPDAKEGIDSLVVEEDVTLYAIFKGSIKAKFEVATKDGSIPATSEYETVECTIYNKENKCNVEIPKLNAKVGYEALGWSKTKYNRTAEYTGGEIIEITKDENYYSVTKNKTARTATFNSYKDGEITQEVLKCYLYNGETSCEIDPSGITSDDYNGNKFLGYTDDVNNLTPVEDFELTKGKEYYAFYDDEYEITYVTGQGDIKSEKVGVTIVVTSTGIKTTVQGATLQEPSRISGWEFIGYRMDDKEGDPVAQPGDEVKVTNDTTYYAMYKKKYTVTYDLDSDVQNKPSNQTGYAYYYSATDKEIKYQIRLAEVDKVMRPSYIFETWEIDGTAYDPGTLITVNENITVTASWRVDGCIIYFDYATNGGTSADKTSLTYINGDGVISLENINAYKTGWTFIGWTDKPGSSTNPLTKFEPDDTTKDHTLYAMFERTVRVDFKIQDGNQRFSLSSNERQEFKIYNADKDTEVVMPDVNILNGNYEFLGWTTVEDSTTPEYQPGDIAKVESYQAFYTVTRAKKPLAANFNYLDENGNGAVDTRKCYLYNGAASCTVTPGITESVVGEAVLGGWSTSETEIKTTTKFAITKETEYYAVYDKVITATFYSGMDKASTVIETKAIQMTVKMNADAHKRINNKDNYYDEIYNKICFVNYF